MRIIALRLTLLPFFLLSACNNSSYNALKAENPQAATYSSALAAEYLSFAESEKEHGRDANAERFAAKGLAAEKGENVKPDTPVDWELPPYEGESVLARLTRLTGEDARRIVPQKAARAQVLYECWIVQTVNKPQSEELYPCQRELGITLNAIEQALIRLPEPRP